MTIRSQITFTMTLAIFIAVIITAGASISTSISSATNNTQTLIGQSLTALREQKKAHIEEYFHNIEKQIHILASNPLIRDSLSGLTGTFTQYVSEVEQQPRLSLIHI